MTSAGADPLLLSANPKLQHPHLVVKQVSNSSNLIHFPKTLDTTNCVFACGPQAHSARALLSNSSLVSELKAQAFDAVMCEHLPAFGLVGTTLASALKVPVLGLDGSTLFWDPPPGLPQVHTGRGRFSDAAV